MKYVMSLFTLVVLISSAWAQPHMPAKHDIAFNRYYDTAEIHAHMRAIAEGYPDLVEIQTIGQSMQGREMLLAIVTAPGDDHSAKPAMFIDGNIHGNEIQAAEVVLYTLWYLTKGYGNNEQITDLLDSYTFYLVPIENPDGRQIWFDSVNSPHSSRWNRTPIDNDRDGLVDEDGPDDLDGDGSIGQMWIRDPNGRWIRDRNDPRIFTRVAPDEKGEWTSLGQEGIDNDGDGRINEDGTDGYDMNRNWPADWLPNYVQQGAGPFPFHSPETRAIGEFVYAHPNIAGYQSYHNAGGMILRGPGAGYRAGQYPRSDTRVYNEIAKLGEQMLPYYRSMVIHADLYTVHGGEATWAAEALGIISFTNELWTASKYFQRDVSRPNEEQMWLHRDRLDFGQTFTPYTEIDHPQHGTVLVGGLNKWASRNTPTFMLEEECHRNFAFTMLHADQMPQVSLEELDVERLGDRLWSVTVTLENDRLMPSRSGRQSSKKIGQPDLLTCTPTPTSGNGRVVASGRLSNDRDTTIDETRFEPGRVLLNSGVPGRGRRIHRFFIEGDEGTEVRIKYTSETAQDLEAVLELKG